MDSIQIKSVMEHIEVYYNGKFLFSADTKDEALNELKSQMNIGEV